MFVLLLKFEEFPGGGEEYRHIESLVFSSTSWGGRVVLSSSVSLLPFLLHGAQKYHWLREFKKFVVLYK